jgi:hypothetical protein
MWVDKHKATKEKPVTTRALKILAVKACCDKTNQPGSRKVDAYVLGHIAFKDICDNDDEQDSRDITEHKKPK